MCLRHADTIICTIRPEINCPSKRAVLYYSVKSLRNTTFLLVSILSFTNVCQCVAYLGSFLCRVYVVA